MLWCVSYCVFVCIGLEAVTVSKSLNSPLAQQHGMIPPQPFLPASIPFSLFTSLLPPSWGGPCCLHPAFTGLLIGNRAAAHLLIESRLGPWGRAVKQAPRGIKSWRLTGYCKSKAANSSGVYPSVLTLDKRLCVHVFVCSSFIGRW